MPEWIAKRIVAIANFAFAVSLASLLWVEYELKVLSLVVILVGVLALAFAISYSD